MLLGEFDDQKVMPLFNKIIDEFLTETVNAKLKVLAPFKTTFFNLENAEKLEDGKYATPSFKSNVFSNEYVQSVMRSFAKSSMIDGKLVMTYNDPEVTKYESAEDAESNGFHEQLLKIMVIDQQVNHLIFLTNFKQLTADYAAFDEAGTLKKFIDNNVKRDKMFVSPFTATADDSKVNVIAYQDVTFGQHKVNRVSVEPQFSDIDKEVMSLLDMDDQLKVYTADGKIPSRYKELSAIYYANRYINNLPIAHVRKILKDALESKITDGGTIITLREYLYQMMQQGVISDQDFTRLYKKYNNPDLQPGDFDLKELKLKGQKMVGATAFISGDRKVPVYMKDGKIVLIPSAVKGTKLETIVRDLTTREGTSEVASPGIQLVPVSALKLSNAKPINLFDNSGNLIQSIIRPDGKAATTIHSAPIFSFPRSGYGEQVQNPDKKGSEITVGSQLQKYLFTDIENSHILAPDQFTSVMEVNGTEFTEHRSLGRTVPAKGITKMELLDSMVNIQREMRERKLQDLINDLGLDYSISDTYKEQMKETGFSSIDEFDNEIDRLAASRDKEERQQASELKYWKFDLVVRSIDKMLSDIKQQAYERKGMDISQLKIFDDIRIIGDGKDQTEQLKIPLTFTPGNKQYQAIVVSKIEKLIAGTKINGFAGIQISSVGHEEADGSGLKSKVEGDTALKGYHLQYDNEGKVTGFDAAEIAIPWIFKDQTGKLLNYSKYVNEDGTPKKEMFTKEMLNIIGYRIPNTGVNMAGRFIIKKFLAPGYSDAIMIPDILYSQMGTDLDFDKLYNYIYNYGIDDKGVISKKQGIIHPRQNGKEAVFNTPEARHNAIHNSLLMSDRGYLSRWKLLSKAYKQLWNEMNELQTEPDTDSSSGVGIGSSQINKETLDAIKQKLTDEVKQSTNPKVAELKQKFDHLIKDYNELNQFITNRANGFSMDSFLQGAKSNYLKVQSYEQLENAYMDIYHIIMSDLKTLGTMMTPLTTDFVKDAVNNKNFNDRSYVDLEQSTMVPAPNTEVFQTDNRAKNQGGDVMIGAMANAQTTAYICQNFGLSVGQKIGDKVEFESPRPVVFLDSDSKIITENQNDEKRFIGPFNNPKLYKDKFQPMTLRIGNKEYAIPHRLDRIYDVTGKVKVIEPIQSVLQGFLDLQKDTSVTLTNINEATINATVAMNRLGYVEQMVPFLQQAIVKDYAKAHFANKSPFTERIDHKINLIADYAAKAGIPGNVINDAMSEGSNDVQATTDYLLGVAMRGDKEFDNQRYFNTAKLNQMIEQHFDNMQDQDFYLNQLYVLNMFARLNAVGQQLFNLQQRTNIDSKGLKDNTVLALRHQLREFNEISNPYNSNFINIIGSERIGNYNPSNNRNAIPNIFQTANSYAKKASNWLYGNHNIFADFSPVFETVRTMMGNMLFEKSLAQQERFNINLIQYLFSNPELYTEFTDMLPEEARHDAAEIRKYVFINQYEKVSSGNKTTISKLSRDSLASLIEKVKEEIDPESGKPYSVTYPVLTFFKTTIQPDSKNPSWVTNFNTNQFRERMGQEMPFNIYMMMKDANPEIQKVAKYFYLYHYLSGGIASPVSFGHMLPQEFLFEPGGFADKMNSTIEFLNEKMQALREEVENNTPEDYNRPRWFAYLDPRIVRQNRDAADILHSFFVQFMQHNRFDSKMRFSLGKQFKVSPDDSDRFILSTLGMRTKAGNERKVLPPSFTDENYNVYVLNRDYATYSRVNAAGTSLFAEYSFGKASTNSVIRGNDIKFSDDINNEQPVLGNELSDSDRAKTPIVENKETELKPLLNWAVSNEQVTTEELSSPEFKELKQLGTILSNFIPAGTKVMPLSLQETQKRYPGFGGLISFNGMPAQGFYKNGPNGYIEIAYGSLIKEKQGITAVKRVLMHESAHAATYNIMNLLRKYRSKELKAREIGDMLGLDTKDSTAAVNLKEMLKSMEGIESVVEYLKTNTIFRNAYQQATGKMDRRTSDDQLDKFILNDVDEFVAHLFNNKALRDALNKVPYKKKTFFDRVKEFLSQLLGINEGTALHSAIGDIFEMLSPLEGSEYLDRGFSSENMESIYNKDSKPLLEEAVKSKVENPFSLKRYDTRLLDEGYQSVSIRPEKMDTGIYEMDGKYYQVTSRGLKSINELKDKDSIRSKSLNEKETNSLHLEEFYAGKLPMYVYDIKKVDFGSAALPANFKGSMKVSGDAGTSLVTGHNIFDKYINATKDYITRLKDERRRYKNDLKKLNEYNDRIEKQEAYLELFRTNKSVRFLVETGEAQLAEVKEYAFDPKADLIELNEGMRIARAWADVGDFVDLLRDNKTEKELDLIDFTRDLQAEAASIASNLWNNLKDRMVMEGRETNTNISSLIDENGNFKITDTDVISANTITGAFSSNPLENLTDAIIKKQTFISNEEWYQYLRDSEAKTAEILGSRHADTSFLNEQYDEEHLDEETGKIIKVPKQGIITMYDRSFYNEYNKLRSQAIRGEIKWKEFYQFERKYFNYELTDQGKEAYEEYINMMKSEYIVDTDDEGNPVYDEKKIEALRKKYDPAIFRAYLDDTTGKLDSNNGGRWFTKQPKDIPINKNYQKLTAEQKRYYEWFTAEYMKSYVNSIFDYHVGQADVDILLMDFTSNLKDKLADKTKYVGAAAVEWLKDIYSVKAGPVKVKSISRTLTGKEHIAPTFKSVGSFIGETGKINPLHILNEFKAASIAYKHKRDVEEMLNTINDIATAAGRQERNNSGMQKVKLSGVPLVTSNTTNVANRIEYTVKRFLNEHANDQNKTFLNKEPGERGFSIEQTFDSLNKFTRFRYMALSPLSASGNFIMGAINNMIYSASGEYFNDKEMMQAAYMLKGAPFKYFTAGKAASKEAKLLAEIMYRYNILGDVTEELAYGHDALSWFFTLQKGGEFMVQGMTALAQMIRQKVETKDGKKVRFFDLYELKDNRLHFKEDLLPENSEWRDVNKVASLFEKIKKVNSKIHGDYTNPQLGKKNVWGRAMFLFRTWLPMSIKERFGAEYDDYVLGKQKGRYRSAASLFRDIFYDTKTKEWQFDKDKAVNAGKLLIKLIPGISKVVNFNDSISEVDRNNLNMFAREMQFVIMLLMGVSALKGVASGDDPDDPDKNILNYLHNQGERMVSELQLYFSPKDYNQIMQQLIPMTKTMIDGEKVVYAFVNYLTNPEKDAYTRGFRKGDSKLKTRVEQFLPLTRSAQSTWAAFSQIYTDDRFK
jgi:hypothetical protein